MASTVAFHTCRPRTLCLYCFKARRIFEDASRPATTLPMLPFLRPVRASLSERQVAHRRAMLAHFDRVVKREA